MRTKFDIHDCIHSWNNLHQPDSVKRLENKIIVKSLVGRKLKGFNKRLQMMKGDGLLICPSLTHKQSNYNLKNV